MSFVRLWLTGYVNPSRFIEELRSKPAPHWGFYGQLLRAVMDSLLVYLPLTLMGRIPPTPSNLSFIPTERYHGALIWLGPPVLIAELLLGVSFIHLVLRLLGRRSDFDKVFNIVGMAALVVGAVLIPWDWAWYAIGGVDQYFLGISHLVIDLWAILLTVLGLKRILGVPVWLGTALNILSISVSLPLAIMFMRSPF